MDTFTAKDSTFGSLLTDYSDRKFIVPDFQRKFVWGKDEISDLFESIIRNEKGYFIGTLVYASEDEEEGNPIHVIDGQQRLVTLFIGMAALRNLLEDQLKIPDNEHRHDDIQNAIATLRNWIVVDSAGPEKSVKLSFFEPEKDVVSVMNHFFRAITEKYMPDAKLSDIEKFAEGIYSASEKIITLKASKQLTGVYRIVKSVIDETAPSISDKIELVGKIKSLRIVRFELKKYDLVHSLFEGLNSKGIKLTRSEQIKNILYEHIIKLSKNDEAESKRLKTKWSDIEYIFDSSELSKGIFDKFLRHYWLANEKLIYMPQLYQEYKRKIQSFSEENQLMNFLEELYECARFYIAVKTSQLNTRDFTYITNKETLSILNQFGLLDNDQVYEVLILYRNIILRNDVSPPILNKWLKNLWLITFRLKYISVSPSDYENELVKYCKNMRDKIDENSPNLNYELDQITVNSIKGKLWQLVENDKQFIENIADKLSYSAKYIPLITKVLSDLFLAEDRTIVINRPSIEHILPQKPTKWNFSANEIKEIVNMLGNLTLLDVTDNRDAGNEPFETKIELVYEKSKFEFNRSIGNYSGFKSRDLLEIDKEINKRGLDLAKQIEKLYRVKL